MCISLKLTSAEITNAYFQSLKLVCISNAFHASVNQWKNYTKMNPDELQPSTSDGEQNLKSA